MRVPFFPLERDNPASDGDVSATWATVFLRFRAGFADPGAFALALIPGIFARKCPVWDAPTDAMYSGVPCATSSPPLSPAPGPRSMIQSAFLMRSRWCSIRITVLP